MQKPISISLIPPVDFFYPYALYSAGQAAQNGTSAQQKSSVSERDTRQTTVIGDSGGYQIQQGTINFSGEATAERMLRWLEAHADFAMTLDFPTGGINSGSVAAHKDRLIREGYDLVSLSKTNGLSLDYNACLLQSQINLDYFTSDRTPGATRLLNVIQGRTEQESKTWYEAVKSYGLEGWAFAGTHQSAFSMTVARLLDMIEDDLLASTEWIHFLGISRIAPAYLFTSILHCLRGANSKIGISFDTSSPFLAAANFSVVTSYKFNKYAFGLETPSFAEQASVFDDRTINELAYDATAPSEAPYTALPVTTAIGSKVRVSEICEMRNGRLRVTTDGVRILMNHNLEERNQAFAALNHSFDSNPLHDEMPVSVRAAKAAIDLIFEQAIEKKDIQKARSILHECRSTLDVFA